MMASRRRVLNAAAALSAAVSIGPTAASASSASRVGLEGQTGSDPSTEGQVLVARTPDGLDLSVRAYGDPRAQEILFVHGLGQSRLSWDRQVAVLSVRFRVVTYDLRGHGDSDKPEVPEAYADAARWADDLKAVIDTAGLRRPVIVGWSLGGLVIGCYLARHGSERVAGVNLVDAVTRLSPELLGPISIAYSAKLASPDLAVRTAAIGDFLAECFAEPPPASDFRRMLVFSWSSTAWSRARSSSASCIFPAMALTQLSPIPCICSSPLARRTP